MLIFFQKGGPLMWPLLLCSLVSVTITLERLLFWWRVGRRRDDHAADGIIEAVESGQEPAAPSRGDYATHVLLSALEHREHGLTEALQTSAQDEIARMRRGLGVLDTIITLAPLLGILGTVMGIIESFDVLAEAGIGDPRAVTGGIAKALITTAAGLSVAIVTLIPYNAFVAAVQGATARLQNAGTRLEVACRKQHATHEP